MAEPLTDLAFKQAHPDADYGNFPITAPTNGAPTPFERAIAIAHRRATSLAYLGASAAGDLVRAILLEYGIDDPEEALIIRYTADAVVFAMINDIWHVLLVKRRWLPFQGRWALPGGHTGKETGLAAAIRELGEETGVHVLSMLPIGSYDTVDRDPRGRYVTAAFGTVLDHAIEPVASDDAAEARWTPVVDALRPHFLAFDHDQIVSDAMHLLNRHQLGEPLAGVTASGRRTL